MKKLIPIVIAALALTVASSALADGNIGAGCPTDVHQIFQNVNLVVNPGGVSTATFTIPQGCSTVKVSLVTYTASSGTFTWQNAVDEKVYDQISQNMGAGTHTLSIHTPDCYYQLDLVLGDVIAAFGPYDTNPGNFYTPQGRLAASANGGTQTCTGGPYVPPAPPVVVNHFKPKLVKPHPKKKVGHAKPKKKPKQPISLPYTP